MAKLIVNIIAFFAIPAFSNNFMTIEGTILQFDDKTIQLKQDNGAIIHIPREAKKEMKGVKLGKDKITVDVRPGDFMRLNAKHFPETQKELEAEKKQKALERQKK